MRDTLQSVGHRNRQKEAICIEGVWGRVDPLPGIQYANRCYSHTVSAANNNGRTRLTLSPIWSN